MGSCSLRKIKFVAAEWFGISKKYNAQQLLHRDYRKQPTPISHQVMETSLCALNYGRSTKKAFYWAIAPHKGLALDITTARLPTNVLLISNYYYY